MGSQTGMSFRVEGNGKGQTCLYAQTKKIQAGGSLEKKATIKD